MDGRRRKTVHAARRPEERPKDASHSSTFTECTSAMLTLPSFAGPTSARSVTRTVRMRFSVGTGADKKRRNCHNPSGRDDSQPGCGAGRAHELRRNQDRGGQPDYVLRMGTVARAPTSRVRLFRFASRCSSGTDRPCTAHRLQVGTSPALARRRALRPGSWRPCRFQTSAHAVAAGILPRAPPEAVRFADWIGLGRRRLAQQPAQVDEVFPAMPSAPSARRPATS